eukprot:1120923-Pleurochrysis_carterae.AAC.3
MVPDRRAVFRIDGRDTILGAAGKLWTKCACVWASGPSCVRACLCADSCSTRIAAWDPLRL